MYKLISYNLSLYNILLKHVDKVIETKTYEVNFLKEIVLLRFNLPKPEFMIFECEYNTRVEIELKEDIIYFPQYMNVRKGKIISLENDFILCSDFPCMNYTYLLINFNII